MTDEDNENSSKAASQRPTLTLSGDRSKFAANKAKAVTVVEVKKKRALRPQDMGLLGDAAMSESFKIDAPSEVDDRVALLKKAVIKAHAEKVAKEEMLANLPKEEIRVDEPVVEEMPSAEEQAILIDPAQPEVNSEHHRKIKSKKEEIAISEDLESETEQAPGKFKKLEIKQNSSRFKNPPTARMSSKVIIQNIDREEERGRSIASIKRAREKARRAFMVDDGQAEKQIKEVILPEFITVAELASRMSERGTEVVRAFMKSGMIVNINQTIDADTAELIIHEFGHKVKRVTDADVENILLEESKNEELLLPRPPVVTVMGHVDHGKTSLLDALRSTDVAMGEAGGITQHIGAYQVKLASGDLVTFIDTPGHQAFTAMRARGAKVTDIVILVVAADDGIKEQTVEAINHAKAAGVPIIVAINKIDTPGANPQKVITELLNHELVAESMGGDIMTVEVSALKKINLDKLIEAILLQSELLELKADVNAKPRGVVIESRVDKQRGVVATLLVQKGILRVSDILVAGDHYGRVRVMSDDKGRDLEEAQPSTPVEITGLEYSPEAGEEFVVVEVERHAREISEYRQKRSRTLRTATASKGTLDELFAKASGNDTTKELALIIKGDVNGSVEAIVASLEKISTDEVKVKILHRGVGGVNESDVTLASASGARIIGFNVRANDQAKKLAEKSDVSIQYYSIIYNLIDDVKSLLSGLLSPVAREQYLGTVEIRQVFNITKVGKVAGAFVLDGVIKRGAGMRLLRDDVVIHEGKLKTLKRFKEEVKEVKSGYECGIAFENYDDIKEKDRVEVYEIIQEKREL